MNLKDILARSFPLAIVTQAVLAAQPIMVGGPSDQFVVTGLRAGKPFAGAMTSTNSPYMVLDPTLVAVSCERIKQSLLRELNLKDHWRGKIFINLQPRWKADAQILVTSAYDAGRWSYRVEIPNEVEKERFLRVVVQVMLLEIANRGAALRQAELPPWLGEGLMAHLRATEPVQLLLEPETTLVNTETKRDPLAQARTRLRARSPLTLDELNWPGPNQFMGENALVYQSCAQLFVTELLHLKGGPECLSALLDQLPQHLNWQTAFLRAFNVYFQRLLDVEKWWSLHLVRFAGRSPGPILPPEECWQRLTDLVTTPVQVRGNKNDLPSTRTVPLQVFIEKTDFHGQVPVLRQKITQLQMLRMHAGPNFLPLVDGYWQVLEGYVHQRSHSGIGSDWKTQALPSVKLILRDTLRHLNALDARRQQMRPVQEHLPTDQAKAKN